MRFRWRIVFGAIVLLSFHVRWCFAPPLPDFSSWQYQPNAQNPMHYTRQCHGDADGIKVGLFWVNTDDAAMFQFVYTYPGGDWPAYYPDSMNYDPRVDFDRNFIVNDDDGDILSEYLNHPVPTDCGQKLQLHPVTGPLIAGTVYTIEWDWNIYTGYVPLPGPGLVDYAAGPFELSYSTGDGSGGVIATVTDATSYDWMVPNVNSTDCQLYIEDLSHPGLVDVMGNTFTILPWTGPVIGVDPDELYFTGLGPPDQTLSIWNAGSGSLHWQITEDCDWLEVAPSSGTSIGEINEVIIHVDTSFLEGGDYECLITVSDSNAINSPVTVPVYLTNNSDCVRINAPFYNDWLGSANPETPTLGWAKPVCWCFPRQCRGDTDGIKVGLFWVGTNDLVTFADAFSKGEAKLDQRTICADLDHRKIGLFRVNPADLAIFARYFNKGEMKVPVCPIDWDPDDIGPLTGDGIDDYNFWIIP